MSEEYKLMSAMTVEEKENLGSMQLSSLEVSKTPTTAFDVAIKSYVDSKFTDAVSEATTAVNLIVDNAPDQLNTLREIALALNNDANLASALTTQIGGVQTSLTTEVADRVSAVATEASARVAADSALESKISAETSARSSADSSLDTRLSAEASTRNLAVLDLEGKISTESSARSSAVATEASARVAADGALETKISEEKTAREAAVSGEATLRVAAVGALEGKISDEKSARESADATHTNDIQALAQNKFDASPYYSGGSESEFKISESACLYIGDLWRIKANNQAGSQRKLEFQYAFDGINFKTAFPFIKGI